MSKKRQSIDHILADWPFEPGEINVRLLQLADREVIQMRIDLGILQLEVSGRPDGSQPNSFPSWMEWLADRAARQIDLELDSDMCLEIDREFVQYYHRRVAWLQLKEFAKAVLDAEHTLRLMDLCKQFSPDDEWTISHEQYRPFVLYHRTKAAALQRLEDEQDAEGAIEEINRGLESLKSVFTEYEVEDKFDDDELVRRLVEFRDGIRARYSIDRTLQEKLDEAIAAERYELAAELRDELAKRRTNGR
jgi:hypothetical protein